MQNCSLIENGGYAMYLDFKAISKDVLFKALLDHLNIEYTEKKGELRGEAKFKFIINIEKNLFLCPGNSEVKGSVINFYSVHADLDLRGAAEWLKKTFLTEAKALKREIPELVLEYHPFLEKAGITKETAEAFEVGYCSKKSIMAGKIAFKIYDPEGIKVGYIGRILKPNKNQREWFFPKGFVRKMVYNSDRVKTDYAIVVPSALEVLYLYQLGFSYTVGLLAKSATEAQIEILKQYRRILLLHPEPANVRNRLAENSFVKAPVLDKPIMEMGKEEVKALFK